MKRYLGPLVFLVAIAAVFILALNAAHAVAPDAGVYGDAGPVVTGPPIVPADPTTDTAFEAITYALEHGNWIALLAGVLVLGTLLIRKLGAKVWPWLATDPGGLVVNVVVTAVVVFVNAALSGKPLNVSMVLGAIVAAAAASGLWTQIKRYLGTWLAKLLPGVFGTKV